VFEPTSRYAPLEVAELELADGRVVRYVRRRFIPPRTASTDLVSHEVKQGERLDHLATRYLADPTQFWRICDANGALRPAELTDQPGRRVDVPLPGGL
jgi:hypothetical protein